MGTTSRARRFLLARRLATRCGSARVSSTWGRIESAGGVATSTCQRASAVSGTQRAASSSCAVSPRASRKASLARTVEIVVTTTCARTCWAARARFAVLPHPHLVSRKASLARTVVFREQLQVLPSSELLRWPWRRRNRLHPHRGGRIDFCLRGGLQRDVAVRRFRLHGDGSKVLEASQHQPASVRARSVEHREQRVHHVP